MVDLTGKIAFVTGGGSGLGAAIARRLSGDGATLVVNDFRQEAAAAVAEEVGGQTAVFDVSDGAAFDAAVDDAVEAHGRIDIMVNNAGIVLDRPEAMRRLVEVQIASATGGTPEPAGMVSTMTDEEFDRMMRVHVYGTFNGTRAALRHMEPARSGSIVNMASMFGLRGSPAAPAYAAAKHAIVGLTRSVGSEVAPFGIRVNAVAPGFVDTPLLDPMSELKPVIVADIPAHRFGRPEEIAAVVAHLAGPEASYHFGDVLPVTGGSGD